MEIHLRTTGCRYSHMGSHNVTCHPTQKNATHLNPSQWRLVLDLPTPKGWKAELTFVPDNTRTGSRTRDRYVGSSTPCRNTNAPRHPGTNVLNCHGLLLFFGQINVFFSSCCLSVDHGCCVLCRNCLRGWWDWQVVRGMSTHDWRLRTSYDQLHAVYTACLLINTWTRLLVNNSTNNSGTLTATSSRRRRPVTVISHISTLQFTHNSSTLRPTNSLYQ